MRDKPANNKQTDAKHNLFVRHNNNNNNDDAESHTNNTQANNIMDIFTLGYISVGLKFGWIGSLVAMALDLRLDRREFDSRPPRLILGWVTFFGQAHHLGISSSHPVQLSLLPTQDGK